MNDLFFIEISNTDKYAVIDSEFSEKVSVCKWYLDRDGYAFSGSLQYLRPKVRPMRQHLHRYLFGKGLDHINKVKLDNRRVNLRQCNQSQNTSNYERPAGNTSKYRGVGKFNKKRYNQKWFAGIKVNNKRIHLGMFENEVDAAKAYNEAAIKHFGEFAILNKFD